MKRFIILVVFCLLTISLVSAKRQNSGRPSVSAVMNKLMERYDPQHKWQRSRLSYTVHVIDNKGHLYTADVESWEPDEFFQISINNDDEHIIKRYEYGEYFTSINRNTDHTRFSEAIYELSQEKIDQCIDFFRLINGSVMEMERAGMKVSTRMKITDFSHRSCYLLSFKNKNKSTDNLFCTGKIRLYVDRLTYDIVGLELINNYNSVCKKLVFDCFSRNAGILIPQFIRSYDNDGKLIHTRIIRTSRLENEGLVMK